MPVRSESEEERRRRRRALIRTHHPDRGGDTAEFIGLLRDLELARPPNDGVPEIRFVRRRRWWQGAIAAVSPFQGQSRRPRRVV